MKPGLGGTRSRPTPKDTRAKLPVLEHPQGALPPSSTFPRRALVVLMLDAVSREGVGGDEIVPCPSPLLPSPAWLVASTACALNDCE